MKTISKIKKKIIDKILMVEQITKIDKKIL